MKKYIILLSVLLSTAALADCESTEFGEEVYPTHCANCHDVLPQQIVPKFQSGDRLDKIDAELIESILNGLNMMPPWKIQEWTDDELNQIICYIRSLENNE